MSTIMLLLAVLCDGRMSRPASMCTCVTRPASVKARVKEELRRYDAVFVGSVTSVRDTVVPLFPESPRSEIRVRLAVVALDQSWKGPASTSLVIWTGAGGGDCGYPFEVGRRYLIFALATDSSRLSAHSCSLTQLLDGAGKYVRALGTPRYRRETPLDSTRP